MKNLKLTKGVKKELALNTILIIKYFNAFFLIPFAPFIFYDLFKKVLIKIAYIIEISLDKHYELSEYFSELITDSIVIYIIHIIIRSITFFLSRRKYLKYIDYLLIVILVILSIDIVTQNDTNISFICLLIFNFVHIFFYLNKLIFEKLLNKIKQD